MSGRQAVLGGNVTGAGIPVRVEPAGGVGARLRGLVGWWVRSVSTLGLPVDGK